MASVGWSIGAGGVPIPISSISRSTYGKKGRPAAGAKSRPALATIFPLRDVHMHDEERNAIHQQNQRQKLQRTLTPLLVPKRVNAPESADCIVLVSSDGVNFRVSRSVLAYASPVFQRLFSGMKTQRLDADSPVSSISSVISEADTLCLSHETLADGTPIIRVQETGKTLDALLRYLYPFPPSPSELFNEQSYRICVDGIKPVLMAAHKYSIRPILDEICGRLLSDLAIPSSNEDEDPFALRIYALSCLIKRKDLAQAAAYATLRVRTTGVFFPELEQLPAIHYFRLLEYQKRCASSVLSLLASKEARLEIDGNGKDEKSNACTSITTCTKFHNGPRSGSKAFWKCFRAKAVDFILESPRTQRTLSPEFIIEVFPYVNKCEDCKERLVADWRVQSVVLKDEIERCIHKVELDLNFPDEVSTSPTDNCKPSMFNLFNKFATIK